MAPNLESSFVKDLQDWLKQRGGGGGGGGGDSGTGTSAKQDLISTGLDIDPGE